MDGWSGVSVFLSWNAPATDGGDPIQGYHVERATTGNFTLIADLSANETWLRDGNVSEHTSYQYRVSAFNAFGQSAPASANWTTGGTPSAPQNVSATGNVTGILVTWNAPAATENFSTYVIYRVAGDELWWQGWTYANDTAYFDGSMAAGENRTYRIAAENQYGPGDLSEAVNGTRAYPPPVAPSPPQNLTAGDGWDGVSVFLHWSAPANAGTHAIDSYRIERSNNGSFELIETLDAWANHHRDANVSEHTSYHYRVRAVSAAGASDPAEMNWTTSGMPSAPQNLTATGSFDGIALAWSPPEHGENFTSYVIYRMLNGTLSWHASVAANATNHSDASMAHGEERTYVVAAQNAYGPGALSNNATAARSMSQAPSAPRNLTASDGWGSVSIELSWDAPENEGTSPVTNYTIDRWNGTAFIQIADQPDWQRWFHDANLSEHTNYTYRVRAVSAHGLGTEADVSWTTGERAGAPQNLAATNLTNGVFLAWEPPAVNETVTGYTIYALVDGNPSWLGTSPANNTTYLDTSLSPGEDRTYLVSATNEYGPGDLSSTADGMRLTTPTAPLNLVATSFLLSNVTLTWDAPANDGGAAITKYRIWRSVGSSANMTLLNETAGSTHTFADTTCPLGATCYYRVSAVNMVGEGPRSNQASGLGG